MTRSREWKADWKSPMADVRHQSPGKIAVRSTNWIGDAVMTTPAMGLLRTAFPLAEIVLIANPLVAELFQSHPYCDRVIVFDKKGPHRGITGFWTFCRTLHAEGFDLAILFQNAIEAALMAFLAGIPTRAGYGTDGRGFLLNHAVRVQPADLRLHHTGYYLGMLRRLGIQGGETGLTLNCTEQELGWARDILQPPKDFWVAVNPGAAYGSAKRWYPRRFAAVADRLCKEYSARILLVGGPGETGIGREIEAHMTSPVLNMTGRTSVRQLMALLSQCSLMVTNDSGPMHIASAFGVPIVALFGPTDHTTTSPSGGRNRIVRKPVHCAPCLKRTCPTDHRCMADITTEDVLKGVAELGLPAVR